MQKEESCARGHGAGGRDRETFKSEGRRARPIFLRALGWPVPPGTRGGGWKVTCLAPECQGHWLYQRGRAAAGNAPPPLEPGSVGPGFRPGELWALWRGLQHWGKGQLDCPRAHGLRHTPIPHANGPALKGPI